MTEGLRGLGIGGCMGLGWFSDSGFDSVGI